jgi:hypothetical protein
MAPIPVVGADDALLTYELSDGIVVVTAASYCRRKNNTRQNRVLVLPNVVAF